jgi:hypothetical protein
MMQRRGEMTRESSIGEPGWCPYFGVISAESELSRLGAGGFPVALTEKASNGRK